MDIYNRPMRMKDMYRVTQKVSPYRLLILAVQLSIVRLWGRFECRIL